MSLFAIRSQDSLNVTQKISTGSERAFTESFPMERRKFVSTFSESKKLFQLLVKRAPIKTRKNLVATLDEIKLNVNFLKIDFFIINKKYLLCVSGIFKVFLPAFEKSSRDKKM